MKIGNLKILFKNDILEIANRKFSEGDLVTILGSGKYGEIIKLTPGSRKVRINFSHINGHYTADITRLSRIILRKKFFIYWHNREIIKF